MKEDEFAKLFKYMEKRFGVIDAKLDDKASQASIERLTRTADVCIQLENL